MTPKNLPVWRSLLFVPVNVPRFVEKAGGMDLDGVVLDLEDSVAPDEKPRARALVADVARGLHAKGLDIVVRINRPLAMAVRDIEAAVGPDVMALALPKITGADHVRLLAEFVSEVEAERGLPDGHTRFIILVETPDAMFSLREIASAHPRIIAMTLGSEDFSLAAGIEPEPDGLMLPKQLTVFAAAAAGILPMGFVGSIADFKDEEKFRAIVRRSKRLGFRGATCIHPLQAKVLNEEYRPSAAELDWSRRVVAAYKEAHAAGRGAVTVDGNMIDVPIVQRAEALLAWDARLAAKAKARAAAG